MSVDSAALDVAIGLAFLFFLLSTVVSAFTEGIAWFTKQRARKLERGLLGLLGENEIAEAVLRHPLVQTDLTAPADKKKPSYVSPRNFSLALIDVLAARGIEPGGDALGGDEAALRKLADESPGLHRQLRVLFAATPSGGFDELRESLEAWFDDGMDRVSGWYKRWAQAVTCVIAIAVTVVFNVSAVKVAETLANEPTVRSAIAAQAQGAAEDGEVDSTAAGKSAEYAVNELEALEIPLLWNEATDDVDLEHVLGWLITVAAISLGAPFWFDALGKLARLRTTGRRPARESDG